MSVLGVSTEPLAPLWAEAFAPPPELTPSEWAEECRFLPETSAVRGARWRNATAPYLRGIMDATRDPTVTKIALMKCHQSGGSEALHNIIGYHIQHDPCPMLMIHPAADVGKDWSKDRLADMIRKTPALRSVITDRRQAKTAHGGESTLTLKMFPGGYLAVGGANTPNSYARWSVRIAIGDDVDRFPPEVKDEGDPANLLTNRTTSYHDGLSIFVSTPTLKNGRIDSLYQRSDQRRYFLPCPRCGRWDWVTWNDPKHFRVGYDEEDPLTARLECPDEEHGGCGAHLLEPERRAMVQKGEWRATKTAQEPGLAGFHLPAMISTIGRVNLTELVSSWLAARQQGARGLRSFINTSLAEPWEERGERIEPHRLMGRREDYGEGVEVPAPVPVLTAGVDVQADRFEIQVLGWGPARERWVVDYRTVPGDPKRVETRAALLEALSRRYTHALGPQLPIVATCIDSGYATEEIYDFVLRHQHRRFYATKGWAKGEWEPIVGKPAQKRYGRRQRPVPLYPVNADAGKRDAMQSLALEVAGPGATHFPQHLDTINEEYFAQLCAEHRETRYNKAGVATHTVWVLDRERNEALDTAVLALAAFRLLNPNIAQLADHLARAAQSPDKGRDGGGDGGRGGPPPAPRGPRRGRRSRTSSYLG